MGRPAPERENYCNMAAVWKGKHDPDPGSNFALALYRGLNPEADQATAFREIAREGNRMLGTTTSRKLGEALAARQGAVMEGAKARGEEVLLEPYVVQWRLIVGSSYGKALEVGLQVHPLYGVPYIPASALKGATRHWCRVAEHDRTKKKVFEAVFGTQSGAGQVTFYDAYCRARLVNGKEDEARPFFIEDVLAPHYRGWYEQGTAPAEWEEPKPVKLLAVRKGVRVALALSSRDGEVLRTAMEWVKECVEWYGVGAKTRKNYGRLRPE